MPYIIFTLRNPKSFKNQTFLCEHFKLIRNYYVLIDNIHFKKYNLIFFMINTYPTYLHHFQFVLVFIKSSKNQDLLYNNLQIMQK